MIASHNSEVWLTLTLFGPMQAKMQGQPLPSMRSRKGLWLLALLTLRRDRPMERERLAGTLWPDSDRTLAFTNLRKTMSELRNSLGDQSGRLQAPDRNGLWLDLVGADVDVLQFDAAIKSGKLTDLEQAVALYSGPLLEGCTEEWVFEERNVREHHCLQALQQLGDAALTGEDYDAASRFYRRAVQMDPWQEAARRGWMEALSKRGDANAALQVYREFVEVLRNDPTATPDEQTRALYQRLRAEARHRADTHAAVAKAAVKKAPATKAADPVPSVNGYLPHPLTDLVGREDERLEVAQCLRRSRLVTLTGVGGIGKTRLAREVVGEVVREYADGVWLASLEALSEGRLVILQLASVLGLREERGRSPLQSVTDHLRRKRLLLVLDNCEHLLEASAQVVSHLLQECGEVRILATSREALRITGETVWSVPALDVPDAQRLLQRESNLAQALMGYKSVQLFVKRAQAVQASFALSDGNTWLVALACRQLEGIPLAIELAAARVRTLNIEQITSRLEDYLGLLTGERRPEQLRQQTLRATLDWSYDLLTEPERSLLRRLSVFAGGWTLEASEQVCSTEGVQVFRHSGVQEQTQRQSGSPNTRTPEHLNTDEVLDLLSSLADKSLVLFEKGEAGGGRYRLLEMVRQYAAEGLQASGEAERIKARHRDWFLAFAEATEPQLKGAEPETWLRRVETEHDNLRAALAWSETDVEGAEAGLRLAGALNRFWNIRGDINEGRASLERALKRAGAQEAIVARAKALNAAGELAHIQGDYASARALNEESLAIYRALGNKRGIAQSLNSLGMLTGQQGNYASACALYEESLTICRELGDKGGIAYSLDNLGIWPVSGATMERPNLCCRRA
jgi:predicted ATPase/DNA-binding SARP family transcriptional activator